MKAFNIILDKLGAVGALLAAAACPVCFPLFATAGAALGLGIFARFEGYMLYVLQGFVLIALLGSVLSWRAHRRMFPLAICGISASLVFIGIHAFFYPPLVYAGLAGVSISAVCNYVARRRCTSCALSPPDIALKSSLTCPECGRQQEETMPADACQYFYECTHCHALLKPQPGDCCVFCSYGSVKCPPQQHELASQSG